MDFYASYLAGGVNDMWDKELGGMPIGRPVLRRQNAEMGRNKKEMPPIDPYAIYLARGVTNIPLNAVRHCKQDNFDEENSIDEARKVYKTRTSTHESQHTNLNTRTSTHELQETNTKRSITTHQGKDIKENT
jgi:hypothetical protein